MTNQLPRWLALLLGIFSINRVSSKELTDSSGESSLERSGSLTGSSGCLTPGRSFKKPKWLTKGSSSRESKRRAALLLLEEQYRKQDDLFWDQNSGAVWQRTIMMGEKCEPPAFSGLILYDERGNRLEEFPMKSPRSAGAAAAALTK